MASLSLHLDPAPQYGAYGVAVDEVGRVLLVETAAGRCYLPGGRIEPGETERQALLREIAEECGWSAAIVEPAGGVAGEAFLEVVQPIMAGAVMLAARYWRVRLVAPIASLPEHLVRWVTPTQALAMLHRPGDRAAVVAAGRAGPIAQPPLAIA